MTKTLTIITTLTLLTNFAHGQVVNDCHDWMINEITNKADSVYITSIHKLIPLDSFDATEIKATLSTTSTKGNKYQITVTTGQFAPSKHVVQIIDTVQTKDEQGNTKPVIRCPELIDGQKAYGIDCTMPRTEIKTLTVAINGETLAIPDTAYKTLFEPHLQHTLLPMRAYETPDGQQLHLYLFGSDGAGAYMAKLVFNHNSYLTTIAFEGDYGFACDF